MTVAVTSGLTAALKKVVLALEDDLRERVSAQPDVLAAWKQEHDAAYKRERTGMSWTEWRDDRVTQAAAAWVLTTVFVRFCEDNRLLRPVWISGPKDRRQEALDAELAYFRVHPEHTNREWLLQAVEHLQNTKATAELVESHSPLWTVSPSGQAAKRLISFWRERTTDDDLIWDLTDPDLSTRFLGDLYQDLSDYAKKTFALLQTPEFVEEFILDQTMEPALAERPLEGFKLIDPTCGSGHFLLGAFARLNDRWAAQAPGLEVQARVQKALDAIHGVDLNPFAVAIARFRLLVAALMACQLKSLERAPGFHILLAVGDSLLHGSAQGFLELPGINDEDSTLSGFYYVTEDLATLRSILEPGQYDVVVGNPPYIQPSDKKLNEAYRARYSSCSGKFALTVPFMERFFQLAKSGNGARSAGWIGQITSNSFMKREFGSKLIESFLPRKDLRLIVDTSGAYIPGHGTPTVIIIGLSQSPLGTSVQTVLSLRGEPGQPDDPAAGLVWSSISDHVKDENFENDYITVTSLAHEVLRRHPWSLTGGAAPGLAERLSVGAIPLEKRVAEIGIVAVIGEEEAFEIPPHSTEPSIPVVLGEAIRDYHLEATPRFWPYDNDFRLVPESVNSRHMWPFRRTVSGYLMFGKTRTQRGLAWVEYGMLARPKLKTARTIAFAFVATHNHFVLDRGGKVFKQSAPVIKLPEGATEDDHLALLGVLNSSTACFWLKQKSQAKGGADNNSGGGNRWSAEPWMERFEFTGTTLEDFPLPSKPSTERARLLDAVGRDAAAGWETVMASAAHVPSAGDLDELRVRHEEMRGQMVFEQEDLDWEVYRAYGLFDEDLTFAGDGRPRIELGERAFEIALARKVAAGEESTAWFTRHGSTPITEIPEHWPQAYRDLVQRRLDLIESNKFINLLERPEYKRRWASEPWEKRVEKALRGWLLDRLEDRKYWFDAQGRPAARSVGQLADVVNRDADLVSVLELWSGRKDQSVTQQLAALLETESEPFLAAYRLKDSGMRKFEAWEHTWELQRREDAGEKIADIPVPPKYTSADFKKQSWWQHRGKLDVPKERFILYPDASRETDSTQLLGWAGWNHAQQALALATLIAEREGEGWADERLVPLVAGLAQLQPWVRQWHDETDAIYQLNLADFLDEELRGRAHQVGITLDQLRAWRPLATTRGRKARA